MRFRGVSGKAAHGERSGSPVVVKLVATLPAISNGQAQHEKWSFGVYFDKRTRACQLVGARSPRMFVRMHSSRIGRALEQIRGSFARYRFSAIQTLPPHPDQLRETTRNIRCLRAEWKMCALVRAAIQLRFWSIFSALLRRRFRPALLVNLPDAGRATRQTERLRPALKHFLKTRFTSSCSRKMHRVAIVRQRTKLFFSKEFRPGAPRGIARDFSLFPRFRDCVSRGLRA